MVQHKQGVHPYGKAGVVEAQKPDQPGRAERDDLRNVGPTEPQHDLRTVHMRRQVHVLGEDMAVFRRDSDEAASRRRRVGGAVIPPLLVHQIIGGDAVKGLP